MNTPLKIAAYTVYFIALAVAGDRLLSLALTRTVVERSNLRYSRMYNQEAGCDILLMGNSRGLSFYQPQIEAATGKKTFNISYNGLPTDLALVLFQDYLDHNPKPKLLILEGTMHGKRKELVTNFGFYSRFSPRIHSLIYKEAEKTGYYQDIFHLTRFNGEVFQRCFYYRNKPDTAWLSNTTISLRALQETEITAEPAVFDEDAAKDYKAIIDLCKRNNIAYRIVVNPFLPEYRKKMANFDFVVNSLSKYINEPIHDFSLSIDSHENFSDVLHVNKRGSQKLVDLLMHEKLLDI